MIVCCVHRTLCEGRSDGKCSSKVNDATASMCHGDLAHVANMKRLDSDLCDQSVYEATEASYRHPAEAGGQQS